MDYRRVITAAAKMGVLWGIGWTIVSVTFNTLIWFGSLHQFAAAAHVTLLGFLASGLLHSFAVGWLAGAGFALLLMVAERNRTILTLSKARFALWAAVMSVTIGVLSFGFRHRAGSVHTHVAADLIFHAIEVVFLAGFGAIAGAATLAIARRGEEPAQLTESAPVAELR